MAFHLIDKVAVEDEGEDSASSDCAVLCIHGLGGSTNTFTPLMPALARHRVVRLDLPGSARSAAAMSTAPLSIAAFVDAVQRVCARLELTRVHLVAHSMGTIVAQHLAAAQPALVRSLALFGPLAAPAEQARAAIRARGEKAQAGGVAAMHDIALGLVQAATSADTRERQPVAAAFVRESLMRQDPAGYARSCFALAEAQAARLERIEAPALLVTGDEDGVAPPQAVRALAERLRRARVVVFNKCGHWTPVERADECVRALRDFLAGVR